MMSRNQWRNGYCGMLLVRRMLAHTMQCSMVDNTQMSLSRGQEQEETRAAERTSGGWVARPF